MLKLAPLSTLAVLALVAPISTAPALAQRYVSEEGQPRVALVKMPYTGAHNVSELSAGPDYLEAGGLVERLRGHGVQVGEVPTVALTAEEEKDYGVWHRMGLANAHLARIVAENERAGRFSVGLLGNCTSLLGVLGGLQASGPSRRPLRVALVFIDSHGDFNTPETTLSGMLGGMPVAVAAGMALRNLRLESSLDPALATRYIVLGGVRDTDPLEQDLLDRSEIVHLSVDDIRSLSPRIDDADGAPLFDGRPHLPARRHGRARSARGGGPSAHRPRRPDERGVGRRARADGALREGRRVRRGVHALERA